MQLMMPVYENCLCQPKGTTLDFVLKQDLGDYCIKCQISNIDNVQAYLASRWTLMGCCISHNYQQISTILGISHKWFYTLNAEKLS